MDNEERASVDPTIPDFSSVSASPLPSNQRPLRTDRPLCGLQRSLWWPLLVCVAGLQLTGLPFGPLAPLAVGNWTWIIGFYMCVYSVVPALFCLLNVGLVLGPGPFRQRLLVYWIASLVLVAGWYCWLGLATWTSGLTRWRDRFPEDFAEMGLWLPFYVLTLQLPLWVVRFFSRQGLVNHRLGDNAALLVKQPPPQFSIRDLMMAIGLLAVTLVCYRWLWVWAEPSPDPLLLRDWLGMWWRTVGISLTILPPIIAWLSTRQFGYFAGWFCTLLYAALVVAAGLVFENDYHAGGLVEIVAAMTAGFAISLTIGLNLVRHFGWRLARE